MSARRNLDAIRRDAPATDRDGPALTLPPKREREPSSRSRYTPINLRPQTLDELLDKCGEHGASAVERAKWSAVMVWTMNSGKYARGGQAAHLLAQEASRRMRGEPSHMEAMNSHARQSLGRAAVAAMLAWEAAGCPHLSRAIANAFQFVTHLNLSRLEMENPE